MTAAWSLAILLLQVPIPMPSNILDRLPPSLLNSAQRLEITEGLAARDYARIEAVIASATKADSAQSAELEAFLGQVEFLSGRMEQAARAFRAAETGGVLRERDRFTLAMALIRNGDMPGARAELETLNRAQPSTPLYIYWLGRLDYGQRLYDDAIRRFSRVIELDHGSYRAYDNLGLAFDMQGKNQQAQAAFENAVALNRKDARPSAWPPHNLGYLLFRLQKWGEAEKALRESLQYNPDLAVTHYHLGRVLEAEGRDAEAASEYRSSIALDPLSAEPCYSLGRLYRRTGQATEAEQAFEEYRARKAKSPPESSSGPSPAEP